VKREGEAGMEVGMDMGTRKHVAMVVILLHFHTRHDTSAEMKTAGDIVDFASV